MSVLVGATVIGAVLAILFALAYGTEPREPGWMGDEPAFTELSAEQREAVAPRWWRKYRKRWLAEMGGTAVGFGVALMGFMHLTNLSGRWLMPLILGGVALLASPLLGQKWQRRTLRRMIAEHCWDGWARFCVHCGYDLRQIERETCPECGAGRRC